MFVGVDNMMINVLSLAEKGSINEIGRFFEKSHTTCSMGLPIKQYSIKSFREILPNTLKIKEVIGKPIITAYLTEKSKMCILKSENEYKQLIALEEEAIRQGYSSFGSHFTFVLTKDVNEILDEKTRKEGISHGTGKQTSYEFRTDELQHEKLW